MAKRAHAYHGDKRRKELDRQKKKEEKLKQREQRKATAVKGEGPPVDWGTPDPVEPVAE